MQRAILDTRLAVRRAFGAAKQGASVQAALQPSAGIEPGALVLVALSGGADSLALAGAVAAEAPKIGVRAGAVIVDHGLQAETAEVASRTADRARDWGLSPVLVRSVRVDRDRGGPEAAARRARYDALVAAAAETGAVAVLTAHTRDDQAEQVMLALARGSGTRSIAGIPPRRPLTDAVVMLRPFLCEEPEITRSVTEQACRELRVTPWHDPHNREERFARVRVRENVLPMLERELGTGATAALARSADLAREDADALDLLSAAALQRAVAAAPAEPPLADVAAQKSSAGATIPATTVAASAAVLAAEPAALRHRALRLLVAQRFGVQLDRRHVLAIAALVTDWHGQGPVFAPGVHVARSGDALLFAPQVGSPRERA